MVVLKAYPQQPSKATNLLNFNNLIAVVIPKILNLVLGNDTENFLAAVSIFNRSFNNLPKVFIGCFNALSFQSLLG